MSDSTADPEETLRHLQKADAVSGLAPGIGHDFNNSLQTVMVSLEMVRRFLAAGRTAEIDAFVSKGLVAAQTAAALNQRFVNFAYRNSADRKPVQFNELLGGLEDMLRRALPNAVKIELALSADLWETQCNAGEAETAIVNLVLNARDAMPKGGALVLRTENTTRPGDGLAPGDYISVTIADAGGGMSPEAAKRAFDPYFTTGGDALRSGLGLSMVRRFARGCGGDVSLSSQPGGGTAVTIFLPRHRA